MQTEAHAQEGERSKKLKCYWACIKRGEDGCMSAGGGHKQKVKVLLGVYQAQRRRSCARWRGAQLKSSSIIGRVSSAAQTEARALEGVTSRKLKCYWVRIKRGADGSARAGGGQKQKGESVIGRVSSAAQTEACADWRGAQAKS